MAYSYHYQKVKLQRVFAIFPYTDILSKDKTFLSTIDIYKFLKKKMATPIQALG